MKLHPGVCPSPNTVQLRQAPTRPRLDRPMLDDDVDDRAASRGALPPPRTQGEITHLPFHAAGHDAPATGAYDRVANLRSNGEPGVLLA